MAKTNIELKEVTMHDGQYYPLQELKEIEKDLEDLHDIMKEFHDIVGEQGESIDQIEVYATSAASNISDGTETLKVTHEKYNKLEQTKTTLTIIGIGLAAGALIGGPVGLGISAHVAPVMVAAGVGSTFGGGVGWLLTRLSFF